LVGLHDENSDSLCLYGFDFAGTYFLMKTCDGKTALLEERSPKFRV
jgi:hypothetical protein